MFIPTYLLLCTKHQTYFAVLDPSHFRTRMMSKGKTPVMVTTQVMPSTPAEQTISTDQLPGSQFAALLAAICDSKHRLDRKLANFKADVKQAQDAAAMKVVHCVRNNKPYQYKRKAHKEQAHFNVQVEESVQEAYDALATIEDSPALQHAREALEKGVQLLAKRQKLTKITDRSDNGWGVVIEYTADKLADNSDNEKRLEKAKKVGLRKRKRLQPASRHPPRYPVVAYPSQFQQQPGPSGARRAGPPSGLQPQQAVQPCFA